MTAAASFHCLNCYMREKKMSHGEMIFYYKKAAKFLFINSALKLKWKGWFENQSPHLYGLVEWAERLVKVSFLLHLLRSLDHLIVSGFEFEVKPVVDKLVIDFQISHLQFAVHAAAFCFVIYFKQRLPDANLSRLLLLPRLLLLLRLLAFFRWIGSRGLVRGDVDSLQSFGHRIFWCQRVLFGGWVIGLLRVRSEGRRGL